MGPTGEWAEPLVPSLYDRDLLRLYVRTKAREWGCSYEQAHFKIRTANGEAESKKDSSGREYQLARLQVDTLD
jgi:hypothetical protein